MHPSPVTDLRTFLPTKDPELSKKFYTDLGFTINWSNEQIAELQIGFPVPAADFLGRSACRQFHDEPECRRCRRLGEHIQRQEFTKEYPGIIGKAPEMEPWGIRVLYLSDLPERRGTIRRCVSRASFPKLRRSIYAISIGKA